MSQNAERRPTDPSHTPVPSPASGPAARPQELPPFRVLLHNDDDMDALFVVKTLLELTPLDPGAAKTVMWSAHTQGRAQVLVTHQERAELYQEQLGDKGLTVSIEPLHATPA